MEHPPCLSELQCEGTSASKRRDGCGLFGLFGYHSLGSIKRAPDAQLLPEHN